MKSDRRALLDKILEYHFACIKLNLYLDNNPYDEEALFQYDLYSKKLKKAKCNYEMEYGPLTNFGYMPSCYPWDWVNDPWPWDNEFYK